MSLQNRGKLAPTSETFYLSPGTIYLLILTTLMVVTGFVFINRVQSASETPVRSDSHGTEASQQAVENYARLPLSFESNVGQVDAKVKFLSHGPGYELFLTREGAVLSLGDPTKKAAHVSPSVLQLQLLGANHDVLVDGLEQLPGKANYLVGNDPS